MTKDRLSNRQIATLKHLAICCAKGGMTTLTRDERESMTPLWRKNIIEIWWKHMPNERPRGPFFRPTERGFVLINAILSAKKAA